MSTQAQGGAGAGGTPEAAIFISFASEDLDAATRLRAGLEAAGKPCWIAPRDIAAGTSYPAAIVSAVAACRAMVLLLTEASNASPHVLSEVELAFNARKPILPVRLSDVLPSPSLHYFLSTTHWFDAESELDERDVKRLTERLDGLVSQDRRRVERERTRRRLRRGGLAAAAALVLLVSAYAAWRREAPQQPRTRVNPSDGQTYVWIEPGMFSMGCSDGDPDCEDDEKPVHPVRIDKGFWLATTEVTAAQYSAQMGAGAAPEEAPGTPVTGMSWAQAKEYCGLIGGRLPSEAEWEYAARAGSTGRYYGTPSDIAWYGDDSGGPQAVGRKAPNAFGLHDMLGNVYEIVLDRYFNAYDDTGDDPPGEPLAPNASATARGGSWVSDAVDLRVSNRLAVDRDLGGPTVGLRCAMDAE